MKADPEAQRRLLDGQELDSRADQLRHRRATLPELAEIEQVRAERAELEGRLRDVRIQVDDLTEEQRRADADVETVRARRERDRGRMDSGAITNPKDLERMQHELVSLERRITTLEDAELEVMEQLEDAQRSLDQLVAGAEEADNRLGALGAARDERFAEVDAELGEVGAHRDPLASQLPEDLLALYQRLREQKGGVGAAELRARRCGGCQLTLDAAEIADIKAAPDDDVVRCEECQRILVRTPESGV